MRSLPLIFVAFLACVESQAGVLPPEKILPKDAVAVVTLPDAPKSWAVFTNSAYGRLWSDPATRPFREKFLARVQSEMLGPLEQQAGLKLTDYAALARGQFTLALIRDEAHAELAPVLVVDAQGDAPKLKSLLADARKKWIAAGRQAKTQQIHGVDFDTYIITQHDLSNPLKNAMPDKKDADSHKDDDETIELLVGQLDSMLLMSTSKSAAEKVLVRQTGGLIPALEQEPLFQADYTALFRNASAYAWVNAKVFFATMVQKAEDEGAGDLNFKALLSASGVSGLKTVASVWRETPEGFLSQVFLGIPESERKGIFKALPAAEKDSSPPPFIPADAVKFIRYRVDLPEAWVTVEKLLREINPGAKESIDFLLENAGKLRDDKYNLRGEITGNLGSDVITYKKAAGADGVAPTVILIGSPNPEKLAAAVKVALEFFGQGATVRETEFLGRKLQTLSAESRSLLSFAASSGYLAFSTDTGLVQEFLRGADEKAKALAALPGLPEAAQRVGGMNSGFFGYDNQREEFRTMFELLRKTAPVQSASKPEGLQAVTQWADFSLLPPFETVQKYFGFSVYGGRSTADGFMVTFFAPRPSVAP